MNEWLLRAGWLAWPLVACALAVLTIFIERYWALGRARVLPRGWAEDCLAALADGQTVSGAGGGLGGELLKAAQGNDEGRRQRLEDAGSQLGRAMERGLDWLSTLAAVSPLLGLTGTILGMIEVFQRITAAGAGDAQVLAGGIWMALISTVLGLIVAIPALVLRQILVSRLERRLAELEAFAIALGQEMEP